MVYFCFISLNRHVKTSDEVDLSMSHWTLENLFRIPNGNTRSTACINSLQSISAYFNPSHGQNGRLFADDIFGCIFVNEKFCISIRISLTFVRKGPISHNQALVQIMAWRPNSSQPFIVYSKGIRAVYLFAIYRHYGVCDGAQHHTLDFPVWLLVWGCIA